MLDERDVSNYLIVASCQFKNKVYQGEFLDDAESYWVMHKVIKKLLSQNQAKFENYLFNDNFDVIQKKEFFKSQEILDGRSIQDLTVIIPKEVGQGLQQEPEDYKNISGSLIDDLTCSNNELMNTYFKMQMCENTLLIHLDFNFCSTLRFALELNENKTVEYLLDKIFDINSREY